MPIPSGVVALPNSKQLLAEANGTHAEAFGSSSNSSCSANAPLSKVLPSVRLAFLPKTWSTYPPGRCPALSRLVGDELAKLPKLVLGVLALVGRGNAGIYCNSEH
jgi:hypothetical protein